MSNLITIEKDNLPALSRTIIENASLAPIAQLNNPEGRVEIMSLIGTTLTFQHTINGVRTNDNLTPEEIAMQKTAILSVVFRYGFLTKKELEFIFSRGMVGEFGEKDIFFNARSVNLWIKKYIDEIRRGVLSQQAKKAQDDFIPRELTEEEKAEAERESWEIFIEYAERCHNLAKEVLLEGTFKPNSLPAVTGSEYFYKSLIRKGLMIEPTKAEKLEAMANLKLEAIKELSDRDKRHIDASNPEITGVTKRLAMSYFIKKRLVLWFLGDEDFISILRGGKVSTE